VGTLRLVRVVRSPVVDLATAALSLAAAVIVTLAAWRSASDGMTRHVAWVAVQGLAVAVGVLLAFVLAMQAARFALRSRDTAEAIAAVWVAALAVAFAGAATVAAGVYIAAYIS
jgi:hypothetical protein